MDTKKLTSLIKRIKRAKSTFSVGGDLMLCIEIDTMPKGEQDTLHLELAMRGIEYKYLTDKIVKRQAA